MLKSLVCCCGSNVRGRHRLLDSSDTNYIQDEDLLIPGELQWDKVSKSFRKSSVTRPNDGYVPPTVPFSCNTAGAGSGSIPVIEDFKLLKTVGKGAFGKVMMTVHHSSRTLYAIKAVPKYKIATQKQIRQIVAEAQILKQVKHPFCVSLQFAFQNDECLFYVFEFAAGGMLFYHLKEEGKFSETKARFYVGEIILALEYLHGFGIIFRDLKPENCMLSAIGHILLTDFGSAKQLSGAEKTATLAGTPHYMAPEVLRGEPYSYSADWWSTGVLLYEMLVGKTPFNSADRLELYRTILRCTFKIPLHVSLRAQSLLHRLIERDPEIRLGYTDCIRSTNSAIEIKEHSFFSTHEITSSEEMRHQSEESERLKSANSSRQRGLSSESIGSAAGSLVRRFSISAAGRLTGNRYQGVPCDWHWEELSRKEVTPPFCPRLSGPTDCSYFDPVMIAIPPTIDELNGTYSVSSTSRKIKIADFDYNGVAPPTPEIVDSAPLEEKDPPLKKEETLMKGEGSSLEEKEPPLKEEGPLKL